MKDWRKVVRGKSGRTFINLRVAELLTLGCNPKEILFYNTIVNTEDKTITLRFKDVDGNIITQEEEEPEKEVAKIKLEDVVDVM